jgi:hypothetical protein
MIEKLVKNEDEGFTNPKDGCYHETQADYLQTELLGFCGCGNPEEMMMYVKALLEKLDKQEWGAYEDKPYMFFVYWANDKGYAEHGTTARCSWLTPQGKELLADINTVIKIGEQPSEASA